MSSLFDRARRVLRTEGLTALLRRTVLLATGHVFQYRTVYVFEYDIEEASELDETDFLPRTDGFDFRIVESNLGADELEKQGLEFRSCALNARERLDRGAVAFCIFVGGELASIGWAAMSQDAKDTLPELPYTIDFAAGEACGADIWTDPKFRRMGLRAYNRFRRLEYLRAHGIRTLRSAIGKGNVAAQRGHSKAAPRMRAEGRFLKVLLWKWWKETPVKEVEKA
ncbi:MAG: hypothetical protein SVP26_04535 [Chloroflexota bacterium]|nr:hypothetical protein [Chloroflexota bacterium]